MHNAHVGRAPWKSFGNAVAYQDGMSMTDLIKAAEADYGVHKGQAYCKVGENPDGSPILVLAPNTAILYRDSDNAVVSPNSVTFGYGELNMTYMGDMMQMFVDDGLVVPDSCFILEDGEKRASREFLVGKVVDPDLLQIPGDPSLIERYIVMNNPQGHGSIRLMPVAHRLACSNMLRSMLFQAEICMPHKKHVGERFKDATRAMRSLKLEMRAHNLLMGLLNETKYDVESAVNAVLNIKPGTAPDKMSGQLRNKQESIFSRSCNPRIGCNGKTLGDVYQGVTNWTTHNEGGRGAKDGQGRFLSVTEGTRGRFERDAFKRLLGLAGVDNPKAWALSTMGI